MAPVPACSIVSNNYLALARVLAESYREHHPGAGVYVCVVDRPHADVRYDALPFETVFAESLGIEGFASLALGYGILELNTAVKPFFLEWLRERRGLERVFYFDPDVLVLDRLGGLERALERGPMVLTPHITAPLDDDRRPSERLVLQSGVYNLGFVGLCLDARTADFLRWWQRRLRRFCVHDVEHGLFVDQSWMDLAPAFLPDVQVERDAIYNVAYWNLAHRRPAFEDRRWRVGGRPLGFFHFSGLAFDDLERVSRYQDRIHLSQRPELRPLFEEYRRRVFAAGHETARRVPYAFGRFEDGRPVPDLARRVLQRVDPGGARWPDPFRCGPGSFVEWLTQPLAFTGGALNRLALSLWEERPDLSGRFPDPCGADLPAFLAHLVGEDGARRAGLPRELVETIGAGAPRLTGAGVRDAAAARVRAPAAGAAAGSLFERIDVTRPGAMAAWLNEPVGLPGARPVITRFALHVHALRGDVRRVYPDPLGRDRRAFAYWFAVIGADELGAHDALVAPVRRSLGLRSRLSLRVRRWRRARAERAERHPAAAQPRRDPHPGAGEAGAERDAAPAGAAVVSDAAPFGVNLVGHFESDTGVGQAARGTRLALRAAGVPLAELSLDHDPTLDVVRGRLHAPQGWPYALTLLHANADETPQVLARLPAAVRAGGRVVGYWFWELAHFPLALADRFALLDEVWAPSRFVERALGALASVPVRCVPPCVPEPAPGASPTAAERDALRAELGAGAERFLFFSCFDARSGLERKDPEALVEAFARALARTRRPMALAVSARYADEALIARLRERARGLPVTVDGRPATRAQIQARLGACDAYVSLHRAEGLGLSLIESLYLGKPVVASAYGGPCDWLDESTGYPVSCRLVALERDHPPYPRGAVWAEPDAEAAAEALRRVAERPEEAAERARAGRERVAALYGIAAAGRRLATELRRLGPAPAARGESC